MLNSCIAVKVISKQRAQPLVSQRCESFLSRHSDSLYHHSDSNHCNHSNPIPKRRADASNPPGCDHMDLINTQSASSLLGHHYHSSVHHASSNSHHSNHSNPTPKERAAASVHILLGCAMLYTLTQFPTAIGNMLLPDSLNRFCWVVPLMPIANSILQCNHSFNFVAYCICSSRFRQEVRHKLRKQRSLADTRL